MITSHKTIVSAILLFIAGSNIIGMDRKGEFKEMNNATPVKKGPQKSPSQEAAEALSELPQSQPQQQEAKKENPVKQALLKHPSLMQDHPYNIMERYDK